MGTNSSFFEIFKSRNGRVFFFVLTFVVLLLYNLVFAKSLYFLFVWDETQEVLWPLVAASLVAAALLRFAFPKFTWVALPLLASMQSMVQFRTLLMLFSLPSQDPDFSFALSVSFLVLAFGATYLLLGRLKDVLVLNLFLLASLAPVAFEYLQWVKLSSNP
jgi:hypothetical protein